MAVKLRLARMGAKKQPAYRIVAAEKRNSRDGGFLETIGRYNPAKQPIVFEYNNERLEYWLHNGAVMSETVNRLVLKSRREALKSAG